MDFEEAEKMITTMRSDYPQCKDPDLRHAMKSLADFLKSKRDVIQTLDDHTIAYIRKRYSAIRS